MRRKLLFSLILILILGLGSACTAIKSGAPYPSNVDWEAAIEILNSGDVDTVFQLHNLEVTLLMKDGSEVYTVEPKIDDIFHEVEKCGAPCSNIALATE